MKLREALISNVRNIVRAGYELEHINVFTGPNKKGKTNTIEAIYWALADYLLDGSSDFGSLKPHNNTKEVVTVELIFDSFKFKKTYCEKWTKTRGSSEVLMTGHDTEYFIDDVKYSVNEGRKMLMDKLGLGEIKTNSKIDIVRSILDPYYLAQNVPWKDLRAFIIDLVGDVDDLTVLNSNVNYSIIKEDLMKYTFNLPTLNKLYKQSIKNNADEIEKNMNVIGGYKLIEDVDPTDLKNAIQLIEEIDNEIAVLRTQGISTVNPNIAKLEKAHLEAQQEYIDSANSDRAELQKLNAGINEKIQAKESLLTVLRKQYNELIDSNNAAKRSTFEVDQNKARIEEQIKSKTERKQELVKQWYEVTDSKYVSSIVSRVCKHCNGVLNDDELDAHKNDWETNKTNRIADIEKAGHILKLEIENLILELEKVKSTVKTDAKLLEAKEEKVNQEIKSLNVDLDLLRKSLQLEYVSTKTEALIVRGKGIKSSLDNERSIKTDNITDNLIEEKQHEKAIHNQVVATHDAYLSIQKKTVEVLELIDIAQKAQVASESKLMMLEDFIKTKLSLLKNNVASVFGDLEFVLVETNIKEGSYNEVCYPLIVGKQTPFERGSGSEKIITGTYIIECVKRAKQLQDLPIIFDEIDKLDTNTIATELKTNSQIISTKVDDINYKKVTLVAR